MEFHHLALLTGRADQAVQNLTALGYQVGELIHCPFQKARLALADHPLNFPRLEIVAPDPDNDGLKSLLSHKGDYMYHQCFTAPDPAAVLAGLENRGVRVRLVAPPMPATLFCGRKVSFHAVEGLGLIELLEADL
jgi:hypothetical protein